MKRSRENTKSYLHQLSEEVGVAISTSGEGQKNMLRACLSKAFGLSIQSMSEAGVLDVTRLQISRVLRILVQKSQFNPEEASAFARDELIPHCLTIDAAVDDVHIRSFVGEIAFFIQISNVPDFGSLFMQVAEKIVSLGDTDACFPAFVGLKFPVSNAFAKTNFLKQVALLLPSLRCFSDDAKRVLKVLDSLEMSVVDRWRWFIATLPQNLALSGEDSLSLWTRVWDSDWDPSGIEIVAIASRILMASPRGLRPMLEATLPIAFVTRILQSEGGELFLSQIESASVRSACKSHVLKQSMNLRFIASFFRDASSFANEMMGDRSLSISRHLFLAGLFEIFGSPISRSYIKQISEMLTSSLPVEDQARLGWLLLQCPDRDSVAELMKGNPTFSPHYIPGYLKWGLSRSSLWGEDMDMLFGYNDTQMAKNILKSMDPIADTSLLLGAFARSKRKITFAAFAEYFSAIAQMKHGPSILSAINVSTSLDAKSAALSLWHSPSVSSWDVTASVGLNGPSEEAQVWGLAIAARLHLVSHHSFSIEWASGAFFAVMQALSRLHFPLSFPLIDNVCELATSLGVDSCFAALSGGEETLTSIRNVSGNSDDGFVYEIVNALSEAKRPSQGLGLLPLASKLGIDLEKIPQILSRIRSQLVMQILSRSDFSVDILTLSVALSYCEGDPKSWHQTTKKNANAAKQAVGQMALELLDKLDERLSRSKQSPLRDALCLRALANLIHFLGPDVQTVGSKVQGLLFRRRSVVQLHAILLEATECLVRHVSADYLLARGDSLIADLLELLPLLSHPTTYRSWITCLQTLRSKSIKAEFWKPVMCELSLPSAILVSLNVAPSVMPDIIASSIALLGTASHTFRKHLLQLLIAILRPNELIDAIQPHCEVLVCNIMECIQVPLLSSLSAELLGIVGPMAMARSKISSTRAVEDLLDESLDWRKFAHATLEQYCPSAMEAAASADAHDQIAFAIQEVIKTGCEEERSTTGKAGAFTRQELDSYQWWSSLPLKQRDRYQAFLTTNYSVPKTNVSSAFDPIFQDSMNATSWCRVLSRTLAHTSKEPFRRLFKATRALAVADRNRMYDLLPIFAVHSVLHISEAAQFLSSEINEACKGGEREHVMVALTLIDSFQRAHNRIVLSNRIAKFKIKAVEEFPYCNRVQSVLSQLDAPVIISAAVRSGFDPHGLRLLEASRTMPSISKLSLNEVVTLKKAFSNLYDPHSVRAVREIAPPSVSTCEDLELENDFDGAVRFAMSCFSDGDKSTNLIASFARSAEMAGQPGASIAILESIKPRSDELQHHLNEAAWRLGRWDDVQNSVAPGLAHPLRSVSLNQPSTVAQQFHAVSNILSSMASHTDSFPDKYLALLNGLADIKYLELHKENSTAIHEYLRRRMEMMWRYRNPEPLRSLYSQLLRLTQETSELGALWLGQTRHSLQCGDFDGAIAAARRIGSLGLKDEYHSEMASILSKMGRKTEAIQFALHSLPNVSPECASRLKARSALWGHELNFHSSTHTLNLLAEAVKQNGSHESFEILGMFHYQMFSSARSSVESAPGPHAIKEMYRAMECHALPGIVAFSKAVTLNQRHIMEAMPRLVTMWLDGNSTMYQTLKEGRLRGYDPEKITQETSTVASRLPPTFFLSSVGHLLSRLSTSETSVAVSGLLVKLLTAHPQPMLWQILAAALSAPSSRASTIQTRILTPYIESGGREALVHFKSLFSCLTSICKHTITGKLTAFDPVKKLVPILPQAKFAVPSIRSLHPSYSKSTSNFYFQSSPHIHSFGEQVDVINSLQKPKRIVIVDSSGRSHFYLMKAKDDPRKDIRMMEIATHLNNIFLKDTSNVTDVLSLQCYAVMALCDDCALIEWVDGTATIRRILDEAYVIDGSGVKISEVQAWKESCDKGKFTKTDLFTKYIFPNSPPVLHQWFQRAFPHTLQWYRARNLFTQSCAVWSMCGHIVGLGDRHAENLLVSLETGQAMHVDFACMFDKGETLRVPETVRFRLTQNVVDGFGITGTYGPFTNCCERALSVLSHNKDVVEGVLETFIFDPLLEWSTKDGRTDPKALIRRCKRRLDGYMDFYGTPKDEVPLSISGQVRSLINHNCKLEVLSDMYIWWMVWL